MREEEYLIAIDFVNFHTKMNLHVKISRTKRSSNLKEFLKAVKKGQLETGRNVPSRKNSISSETCFGKQHARPYFQEW